MQGLCVVVLAAAFSQRLRERLGVVKVASVQNLNRILFKI